MNATVHAYNNKTLSEFHNRVYSNFLNEDNLVGNEIAINVAGEKVVGFVLKKELTQYFLRTKELGKLPIKVGKTFEVIDGKNVYHVITDFKHLSLEGSDENTFRWVVDNFCNFRHTNQDHFLIWKIMVLAGYVSRINFRVATPPAFGKDSCIDALRDLVNNAARIDKATFAKLEYVLRFPFIVCNEVAGLSSAEKKEFESFGLSAGAFQNIYTKRSRRSHGTKEVYDISKLSLGFTYNNRECYEAMGGKGFDSAFPIQFLDRFLPLKMEGSLLISQFGSDGEVSWGAECDANMKVYQGIIQKLAYLVEHPPMAKFLSEWDLRDQKEGRHTKSFKTICLFISLYASDKDEYFRLCKILYECYKDYLSSELQEYEPETITEEIKNG